MIITDAFIGEGACVDDSTGDELYHADFVDGSGDDPLSFLVPLPSIELYEPVWDDGVSHCYELERSTALDQFLEQCVGDYRFDVSSYKEICVSGWWCTTNSISFSDETDANLFCIRFGK